MSRRTAACKISPSQRRRAIETYTALHEGLPPNEFVCERVETPRASRTLGQATEIQYLKTVPEGEPHYHHPWAKQAQPTIAVDSKGQLLFHSGRYETTRRGIEDRVLPGMKTERYLKKPYVQRERLPPEPKSLTTLGKLEWIKYKWYTQSGWREKKMAFPAAIAPAVAHDEHGNLHVLHGRYAIDEQGDVAQMMSYDNPRRRRRSRRRRHANPFDTKGRWHSPRSGRFTSRRRRRNPSSSSRSSRRRTGAQHSGRMILNTIVVGGIAAIDIALVRYALAAWAPTWNLTAQGLTKITVGLLAGVGLSYVQPQIAQGVAVGGMADGLYDLYSQFIAPHIGAAPQQTVTITAPAPGGQVLLPGVPAQYAGYTPAACGVPVR